jgi:hypothetical protein
LCSTCHTKELTIHPVQEKSISGAP